MLLLGIFEFQMKIYHSLRFRLLTTILVLLAVLGGALIFNGYRVIQTALIENVKVSVKQTSHTLNLAITPFTIKNDLITLAAYFDSYLSDGVENAETPQGLVYLMITDEKGSILLSSGREKGQLTAPKPDPTADYSQAALRGLVNVKQPILLFNNQVGFLHYGLSTRLMLEAAAKSLKQGVFVVALGLIISTIIVFFIGLGFTRRITNLISASEALSRGNYNKPASEEGSDEITQLAHHFNLMADSVSQRQQELEKSKQSLRATIENTPNVAIQWFTIDGKVILWNRASELIFDIPASLALGKLIDELISEKAHPGRFGKLINEISEENHVVGPYEAAYTKPSGKTGVIISTTFRISDANASIIFVNMSVDITQQKHIEAELEERVAERTISLNKRNEELSAAMQKLQQAQESLIQSEKLASLGALVAGVAHELGTPLGNALTLVTSMEDRTKEFLSEYQSGLRRSSLENYINLVQISSPAITRNLLRASELINGFKHVAVDQTSSQRREFELGDLVREVVSTLQHTYKKTPYSLDTDIPEGISMNSYPGPLGQVITNLINNALLHAFEGRDSGSMLLVARKTTAEMVYIEFSDNGNGIPEQNLKRIFDPFFTTKLGRGGSGLGLHIVHSIIEGLLGGHIKLESKPREGTKFTIEIPLRAPNAH